MSDETTCPKCGRVLLPWEREKGGHDCEEDE